MENIGKKFNRWTVIDVAEKIGYNKRYICECDCGTRKVLIFSLIKNGYSKSCGCLTKDINKERIVKLSTKHGKSKSRLYTIWKGIRQRCSNPNASGYKNYGGKGVKVCEEWNDFEIFEKWAIDNGYSDTLEIDRIDSNLNYEPNNCRWITKSENVKKRMVESGVPILKSGFTIEQCEQAKQMRKDGMTYKAIGEKLGCSISHAKRLVDGEVKYFKIS